MHVHQDSWDSTEAGLVATGLAGAKGNNQAVLDGFRDQLEACRLPDRIREAAAATNARMGHQALYLLELMRPQRCVLHLSCSKNQNEYVLDLVVLSGGPAVVFHSVIGSHGSWRRYLYSYSRFLRPQIAFQHDFKPAAISDETVRLWLFFLLSGFKRKLKSEMRASIEIPRCEL
jgi:hypothetical protein